MTWQGSGCEEFHHPVRTQKYQPTGGGERGKEGRGWGGREGMGREGEGVRERE